MAGDPGLVFEDLDSNNQGPVSACSEIAIAKTCKATVKLTEVNLEADIEDVRKEYAE